MMNSIDMVCIYLVGNSTLRIWLLIHPVDYYYYLQLLSSLFYTWLLLHVLLFFSNGGCVVLILFDVFTGMRGVK